ncbi:hypothetical protein IFU39_16700 [Paenibacillus sp. CFBP 13594]|uniref:hypothetical protein n=1 Tax=Paenibacillus sp. CFBP 13594 TaxID=2774037 RepID=UPI0017843333|nr:hypothetical protein [Paenibacillus sp. CFBP 13594]MBD8839454.1 hypothetical protein [Paenibacillus sp. CFBP 13594]
MTEFQMNKMSSEIGNQIYKEADGTTNSAINFGVAMVIASVFDWCDEVEVLNISPSPTDIKKAMNDWIHSEDEIKEMFYRMYTK